MTAPIRIPPGQTAPCRGCRREVAGRVTARERGVHEHAGGGLCAACLKAETVRQRRERALLDALAQLNGPARAWRKDAACGLADPRPFDGDGVTVGHGRVQIPLAMRMVALRYCGRCPVRRACAAEADAGGFTGLWGGSLRLGQDSKRYRVHDLLDPAGLDAALTERRSA